MGLSRGDPLENESPRSIGRLGALVMVLALASLVSAGAEPATPPEAPSGQQVAADALLDHDFGFKLRRPDDGWRLMNEQQIRRFSPDAVAGVMSNDGNVWGAVIVEKLPGGSVMDYANLLIEGMDVEDKQVLEKRSTEFLARPAVRYEVEGMVDGLAVRFATVVVARDGWIYQVIGWGLAARVPDASGLAAVHQAFSLLDGPVRGRVSGSILSDAYGPGWELSGGRFRSASFGLVVTQAHDWRLMVGDELQEVNSSAEAGLYHAATETYLIVIPEVASVEDKKAFTGYVRSSLSEGLRSEAVERIALEVAGVGREFDAYRPDDPVPVEYLHAVWFRQDVCFQVLVWYAAGSREQSRRVVPSGLANLDFLPQSEKDELAGELAGLPDPASSVGPGYSLRNGRYLDFEVGIAWERPSEGVWDIVAGHQARAENEAASLVFEEKTGGLNGVVILEEAGGMDPPDYHGAVLDGLTAGLGISEKPAVSTLEMNGIEGLTSRLSLQYEGALPMTVRVATMVVDGIGAQITISGMQANMAARSSTVDAALRGMGPLPAALVATSTRDGVYRDHRMGFAVAVPPGFGEVEDGTPPELAPLGAVVSWSAKTEEIAVMALNAGGDGIDDGFFMQMIQPLVERQLESNRFGDVVPFEFELAGLPATGRAYSKGSQRLDLYIITRGRMVYGLLVRAKEEQRIPVLRRVFSLLD